MFLTTRLHCETVYSSPESWSNSVNLSAVTQIFRGSETLSTLVPLSNSPCLHLAFHLWCQGTWLLGSHPPPSQRPHFYHTAFIWVPLPFPLLLSQPCTLLFWVGRTSLLQVFNSHQEVKWTLISTSGHLGSSPTPAFYWPCYPQLFSSLTGKVRTIPILYWLLSWKLSKLISVHIWWAIKYYVREVDFIFIQRDMLLFPYATKSHHCPQLHSCTTGTFCNSLPSLYPTTFHPSPWPSLRLVPSCCSWFSPSRASI